MNAPEITEALNRHGAFLKKRVLDELRLVPGLEIGGEEIGTAFGGTRVADVVAFEKFRKSTLLFVFECKRVAPERQWVFLLHSDSIFRLARSRSLVGVHSEFKRDLPADNRVCSEGFEYPMREGRADQDPVFKAASQLCAAYLGLVKRRCQELANTDTIERFAPVLVTTAPLFIATQNWSKVSLLDGRMPEDVQLRSVDYLVLKHPFPTPEALEVDFRSAAQGDAWVHVYTESIYVVRAEKVTEFLSKQRREEIAME